MERMFSTFLTQQWLEVSAWHIALQLPRLAVFGEPGEPQASWTEQQFHGKVRRWAVRRRGGGGAPSGTDRCFPEVRGRPHTSCPASPGPGMVPTWMQEQGHFIHPGRRVPPNPWAHSTPRQPQHHSVPTPFHRLSVNTLKIAFLKFRFPPLLQFSGLP